MSRKFDKPKSKVTLNDIKHEMDKAKLPKTIFMNENLESANLTEIKWESGQKEKMDREKMINDLTSKANEDNARTLEYNETIERVSSKYSQFRPVGDLLVRAFVKPVESNNGLIIYDLRDKIPILANAGNAPHRMIDNPYNYQPKAIIVAVPDGEKFYKPGQIISIPQSLVRAPIPMSEYLDITYGFTHPDYLHLQPPTNKKDIHFGYLLIPRSIVKGFLGEEREIIIID
jgi:hypothetical protein